MLVLTDITQKTLAKLTGEELHKLFLGCFSARAKTAAAPLGFNPGVPLGDVANPLAFCVQVAAEINGEALDHASHDDLEELAVDCVDRLAGHVAALEEIKSRVENYLTLRMISVQ